MKVFISGKISGLEQPAIREKFARSDAELRKQGHQTFVPCILPVYENVPHEDYMHICFAMIDICDAVYLQKDWQESKGARMEMQYAKEWKKTLIFEDQSTKE